MPFNLSNPEVWRHLGFVRRLADQQSTRPLKFLSPGVSGHCATLESVVNPITSVAAKPLTGRSLLRHEFRKGSAPNVVASPRKRNGRYAGSVPPVGVIQILK